MGSVSIDTPVGKLLVVELDNAIVSVRWSRSPGGAPSPLLAEARRQLIAYFAGKLKKFDLPLAPSGTGFQHRVWGRMLDIPYGQTISYGEMAKHLKSAARAVGGACGANPIPIIVPCHRVMAAHGRDGGYSGQGGVATKRHLLQLEGAALL